MDDREGVPFRIGVGAQWNARETINDVHWDPNTTSKGDGLGASNHCGFIVDGRAVVLPLPWGVDGGSLSMCSALMANKDDGTYVAISYASNGGDFDVGHHVLV
jgi:hypothetical protein